MKVNYLNAMNTSASALSAHRRWMNAISENLANAQTTRTLEGGPYRRKRVVFESIGGERPEARSGKTSAIADPVRTHPAHLTGVPRGNGETAGEAMVRAHVVEDGQTPFTRVHDPGHPDADEEGWVNYPNINPVTEMVNLILASRAYEASVAALAADKRMQEMALSIGKP